VIVLIVVLAAGTVALVMIVVLVITIVSPAMTGAGTKALAPTMRLRPCLPRSRAIR
jgi:hypothetical protein